MVTITPKDAQAMGRYLHQEKWQTALAKDLRMEEETFHQWMEGKFFPDEAMQAQLIEITAIRYCTNQIGEAKAKGAFSPAATLVFRQEETGWSQDVDWAIKQKAIVVLKEYGITAMAEM